MNDNDYKVKLQMIMSVIVVIIVTLVIDAIVIVSNPQWMLDDSTIVTAYTVPIVSMLVGTVVYAAYIKIFGVGWRVMPTLLLTALVSFAVLAILGRVPGVSEYFTHRYEQSQISKGSSSHTIGIGDVPDNVVFSVQQALPNNWSVFGIDSNSDPVRYWFVANNDKTGDSLVGFINKDNSGKIQSLTVEQIWRTVQLNEALPSTVTVKQVSGLPLPNDTLSSVEEFFQSKTIYFLSRDNQDFKVTLSVERGKLDVVTSRQ